MLVEFIQKHKKHTKHLDHFKSTLYFVFFKSTHGTENTEVTCSIFKKHIWHMKYLDHFRHRKHKHYRGCIHLKAHVTPKTQNSLKHLMALVQKHKQHILHLDHFKSNFNFVQSHVWHRKHTGDILKVYSYWHMKHLDHVKHTKHRKHKHHRGGIYPKHMWHNEKYKSHWISWFRGSKAQTAHESLGSIQV